MSKKQNKDHRKSNLSRRMGVRVIKQSFLVVCEGENTEPDYFKAFRMTAATIKAVGQAMNTVSLVNKAISIREAERARKRPYDQCWVVFDKDDYSDNDFNQAILLAQNNGFRVAYSNQAFEYWFLLHFNRYMGAIHRNQYPDILTKLIGMPYSKIQGFGALMYRLLLSRQQQAIDNADAVLAEISHGNPAQEPLYVQMVGDKPFYAVKTDNGIEAVAIVKESSIPFITKDRVFKYNAENDNICAKIPMY